MWAEICRRVVERSGGSLGEMEAVWRLSINNLVGRNSSPSFFDVNCKSLEAAPGFGHLPIGFVIQLYNAQPY
jgi:hypothetical protein